MVEAKANLLSAYDPSYPLESGVEAEDLLSLIQARAELVGPRVRGLHRIVTGEDPRNVVSRLRYLHDIEPEKFLFTKRWIPVDTWCGSTLAEIADAVGRMGEDVNEDESWKIALSHYGRSPVKLGKLIDTLSHCILKPRSDLDPQRIVSVVVLEEGTAVSLLSRTDMLEVASKLPMPVDGRSGGRVSVE